MDNISNNNIGSQAVNIDTELINFCNNLINSGLTDGQKVYLLLEIQRVFNAELKTADNVITNTQNLGNKVDASVKDYRDKIKKLQAVNSIYLEQIFNQLYSEEKISASQRNGCIEHYINRLPLAEVQTDRSNMREKLREKLRGFESCVKGAGKLKPYN